MSVEEKPKSPFENIALTLSGGGYRAASFALGTMSYLHRVKIGNDSLLTKVKAISTVSGGTITGICYAALSSQGKKFEVIFKEVYDFLNKDDLLLNTALKKLEDENFWKKTHKRRSLINAFAEAYKELLINANLQSIKDNPSNLEEVIFNTTDFTYGLAFRFQTEGLLSNLPLNKNQQVFSSIPKHLLLSDILAASSCFPFGFEPIIFPDDFMDGNTMEFKQLKKVKDFEDGVGLMDGGIVDNQGVKGILLSQKRREKSGSKFKPFNLIIIADVASPYLEPWRVSSTNNKNWRGLSYSSFNLNSFKIIPSQYLVFARLAIIFSIILIFILFTTNTSPIINCILSFFGGLFLAGGSLILISKKLIQHILKQKIKEGANYFINLLPAFYKPLLKHFDQLKFGLVERMLRERGSSAVKLVSEVFLKQVRRLNYYQIYEDENWKYKRISNLIYELTKRDFMTKQKRLEEGESYENEIIPELRKIGEQLQKVAETAASMDTTLWFSKDDKKKKMLNNLIACGQSTMCYNLLMYLWQINSKEDSGYFKFREMATHPELVDCYNRLLEDWKMFNSDPFFLFTDLEEERHTSK